MSQEVPLRKEITDYEVKVIGSASVRNIIWGAVAVATCVGTAALSVFLKIPAEIASWIFIFVGVPAICIGFIKPKTGQSPERYILDWVGHYLGRNVWVYHSESPFLVMEDAAVTITRKELRRARKEPEYASH